MLETSTFRKNKIELAEYDFEKDIANRILMAGFSPRDLEVLEEILYSSIRFPISKLFENLDISEPDLFASLEQLTQTKLFTIEEDQIVVDKEMRKYYEFQIQKFEEDFKPGMEYLHGLLRKVPIHLLPNWYSIPRSSNNIFESLVEKYFRIPQVYQRYLLDLQLTDSVQKGILNAVYHSPNYEVNAEDMIKKFDLTRQQFEECMLFLEFSFVCCASFVKEGDHFKEIITPFHEWQKYLCSIKDSQPETIIDDDTIEKEETSDFAFIKEMKSALTEDLGVLSSRLQTLGFFDENRNISEEGHDWLKMNIEDQALYLHRHPENGFAEEGFAEKLCEMRTVYEAEKSANSVVNAGWVFLDEFLEKVFVPLNETQAIHLKRCGRSWKYQLPEYNEEEIDYFKSIITKRFFQLGMTAHGTKDGRECFCLTPFGQAFFGNE